MFRPDSPAGPAGPAGFCFADVFVIFSGWVFTEEVFKGGIPLGIDNYLF